jgi:hypothetical protein
LNHHFDAFAWREEELVALFQRWSAPPSVAIK